MRKTCVAALLALALACTCALPAVNQIAWDVIDQPLKIGPRLDRDVALRWERLFSPDKGQWFSRQIGFLVQRLPEDAPTLFASRFVYSGDPWKKHGAFNRFSWATTSREVRGALLREMRLSGDPVYASLIAQHLPRESDPELAVAELATLWLLGSGQVPQFALRMADARLRLPPEGEGLLANQHPVARSRALDVLIDCVGIDAAPTLQALDWALVEPGADASERLHALARLAPGKAQAVLDRALAHLASDLAAGRLDDDGITALVLVCARFSAPHQPETTRILLHLAATARRGIAAAAATTLTAHPIALAQTNLNAIAARARDPDEDGVVRQALFNLLVRVQPRHAAEAGGAGNPWAELANHRARLERWAWEQYVK